MRFKPCGSGPSKPESANYTPENVSNQGQASFIPGRQRLRGVRASIRLPSMCTEIRWPSFPGLVSVSRTLLGGEWSQEIVFGLGFGIGFFGGFAGVCTMGEYDWGTTRSEAYVTTTNAYICIAEPSSTAVISAGWGEGTSPRFRSAAAPLAGQQEFHSRRCRAPVLGMHSVSFSGFDHGGFAISNAPETKQLWGFPLVAGSRGGGGGRPGGGGGMIVHTR